MISVTHDANVLASSAVARPGGTLATIVRAWFSGRYEVVRSEHIHDELRRSLEKPYFANRLSRADRLAFAEHVRAKARAAEITVAVSGVATHPEDDLVLATAVSAGADYLVTGDRKLQALGTYVTYASSVRGSLWTFSPRRRPTRSIRAARLRTERQLPAHTSAAATALATRVAQLNA